MVQRVVRVRKPNVYIGGEENPYLVRWHVIPRNRFFNIYLNELHRSDDDRAMHDHPWWWASFMLREGYIEIHDDGWTHHEVGRFRIRGAMYRHRLEIYWPDTRPFRTFMGEDTNPLTLFFTGPKIREWGFHCPQGWRHWREFTDASGSRIGKGCD